MEYMRPVSKIKDVRLRAGDVAKFVGRLPACTKPGILSQLHKPGGMPCTWESEGRRVSEI